jgi:hypothetical protein
MVRALSWLFLPLDSSRSVAVAVVVRKKQQLKRNKKTKGRKISQRRKAKVMEEWDWCKNLLPSPLPITTLFLILISTMQQPELAAPLLPADNRQQLMWVLASDFEVAGWDWSKAKKCLIKLFVAKHGKKQKEGKKKGKRAANTHWTDEWFACLSLVLSLVLLATSTWSTNSAGRTQDADYWTKMEDISGGTIYPPPCKCQKLGPSRLWRRMLLVHHFI